jgi:enamine deaminase RidA (YjgF/YER057c/UK114 family)
MQAMATHGGRARKWHVFSPLPLDKDAGDRQTRLLPISRSGLAPRRLARLEMPVTPEEKLASLGLTLPPVPKPVANYVPYRFAGNLLFLSGQGPRKPDGSFSLGRFGRDNLTVEQGYADARLVGLQLLAAAKAAVGELSRIEAVVKLLGMVNAEPDFGDHPKVINGCSDLLVEVLGEAGRHARSAVGMGSLPNRMTVEIEAIMLVAR